MKSIQPSRGPAILPRLSIEELKPAATPCPTVVFCVIKEVTQGLIKAFPMPNTARDRVAHHIEWHTAIEKSLRLKKSSLPQYIEAPVLF